MWEIYTFQRRNSLEIVAGIYKFCKVQPELKANPFSPWSSLWLIENEFIGKCCDEHVQSREPEVLGFRKYHACSCWGPDIVFLWHVSWFVPICCFLKLFSLLCSVLKNGLYLLASVLAAYELSPKLFFVIFSYDKLNCQAILIHKLDKTFTTWVVSVSRQLGL